MCNLRFDRYSAWKVTADTKVANLEIADVAGITADHPVTVTFDSTTSVVAGTYGNVTLEGPGVDQWPELPPEETPEASVQEPPETATPAPTVTPEPTPEPTQEPGESAGPSGGVIALILVLCAGVIAGAVVLVRKKRK